MALCCEEMSEENAGGISGRNSSTPYSGGYGDFLQKHTPVDLYKPDHIVMYSND
jgi:hypothetical protein